MQLFIQSLSTEFIKCKNTFAWWLIILGSGFMPAFVSFVFLSKWEHLVPAPGHNPWDDFTEMSWKGMGFLYSAFFVVLLTCLFLNIEHKNNAWKQLLTLPISKHRIYLNKLVTLLIFIALFYLLYIPLWIGSGFAVGVIKPQLKLTIHCPDYKLLFGLCAHSFIASLAVLAIHFWLSIRFKNMIIPIAIALVCSIVWIAMYQGKAQQITYFPYAFHYSTVNPPHWIKMKMYAGLPQHELYSILYFILITGLSYRDFIKNFKG